MTAKSTPTRPSAEEVLAAAPPVRHEPGARDRIRAAHAAAGRRIAVLDDDPTGSQTVHDVSVVTVFEDAEYAAGLAEPGSTCFVLTNTRSLLEDAAVELNTRVAGSLFTLGRPWAHPSSRQPQRFHLRGHVLAEMQAIDAARRRVTGTGFDGVLLVPAYFEAGRFTAGDIHWANVDGEPVPVGDSEFAKDATFGYTSSNLREFVAEKATARSPADRPPISLTDIREGDPTGSPTSSPRSPAARSSWSTPPTTPTWRSSSSAGSRPRSREVVRLPLVRRSPVLWPGSNLKACHRGADLADRSSRRPRPASSVRMRPDEPAGRQGAGTRRPDRNRTDVPPCLIPTAATPTSPPSGGRSSRRSPPPMCFCSPAAP